ncbi:hypothetical protein PMAYCL1PPCAC_28233, partial [Pristionchus mayeri]
LFRSLLLLFLLLPLLFSAPLLGFNMTFNGKEFAKNNTNAFEARGEYGVAFNVPENLNQRRYLGMTREAATEMVNRFIKQSLEASGGKLFKP